MNRSCKMGAILLACALSMSLFACAKADVSTADPAAKPGTRTTLRQMYSTEITTLNYLYASDLTDCEVSANIIECLVEHDPYGVIRPSLAESWEFNEDYTVWTFHIRQGIPWVDYQGNEVAEVTAQDWVDAAKWINTAANQAGPQYLHNDVIKNAAAYYDYTAYLQTSENNTKTTDAKGNPIEVVAPVDFSSVGVQAVDKYTLVYTLEVPTPYFVSLLLYTAYMPVYGPFLEEQGERFGTDPTTLLYNGGFIVSEFEPQNYRTYVKNPHYWDPENIHIERVESFYNSSANTIGPEAFLRDEVDSTQLDASLLSAWRANAEKKEIPSPSRPNNSFTYFMSFNFEPRFNESAQPDNWIKAVNNENFRLSLVYAIDRKNALRVQEPEHPEWLINNTITPVDFARNDGIDYTQYPALKPFTDEDRFNPTRAQEYKAKAMQELTSAGATFPVKVYMRYNPAIVGWDQECQLLQQQLEGTLGKDYIQVIIEAGPSSNFLATVRRTGDFGFLKTTWGADYADPQTFTDPFDRNNTYTFMNQDASREVAGKPCDNKSSETQALVEEYFELKEKAVGITNDMTARYTAFAEAEAFLIEHGFVIPFSIHSDGYVATRLNMFEAPNAPYGLSNYRLKYLYVYDEPATTAKFNERYEQWKKDAVEARKNE